MSRSVSVWPQDHRRNVDHVSDEPKRQYKKTMLHLCHSPMFRCLIMDLQKHSTKNAETSDDDRENTAEAVPHSSSSHWEWRPEYEVPPPEPGDPVMTRRRFVSKKTSN